MLLVPVFTISLEVMTKRIHESIFTFGGLSAGLLTLIWVGMFEGILVEMRDAARSKDIRKLQELNTKAFWALAAILVF